MYSLPAVFMYILAGVLICLENVTRFQHSFPENMQELNGAFETCVPKSTCSPSGRPDRFARRSSYLRYSEGIWRCQGGAVHLNEEEEEEEEKDPV